MFGRPLVAAVVLGLVLTATAASEAATTRAAGTHKLIVVVKRNLAPAAEKRLAILILVTQNGGAASGAVATPSKQLTVLLGNRGLYRVKAEIDSSCKGTCSGSYRISGSANHKLEVVPNCRPKGTGFVCSKVTVVKLY